MAYQASTQWGEEHALRIWRTLHDGPEHQPSDSRGASKARAKSEGAALVEAGQGTLLWT